MALRAVGRERRGGGLYEERRAVQGWRLHSLFCSPEEAGAAVRRLEARAHAPLPLRVAQLLRPRRQWRWRGTCPQSGRKVCTRRTHSYSMWRRGTIEYIYYYCCCGARGVAAAAAEGVARLVVERARERLGVALREAQLLA